jgi:hypothetical protein
MSTSGFACRKVGTICLSCGIFFNYLCTRCVSEVLLPSGAASSLAPTFRGFSRVPSPSIRLVPSTPKCGCGAGANKGWIRRYDHETLTDMDASNKEKIASIAPPFDALLKGLPPISVGSSMAQRHWWRHPLGGSTPGAMAEDVHWRCLALVQSMA